VDAVREALAMAEKQVEMLRKVVKKRDAEQEVCKHLNSQIRGGEAIGHATCPDCGSMSVGWDLLWNNWLKEFQQMRNEWKQSLPD
jgi:predicted RNA-binding Zn-ribbon protein involved in translation (DUF1610 family)